ncbi:hypothetical protein BJF79_43755 [Actinomadura sp. CNU-125]|nr:hypothetical protein BJF79_43755 [Actinomadura sp. CNU-125]
MRVPQANTSAAVPTRPSNSCSGATQPGLPTTLPVRVWRSAASMARAIPKSMTRGPVAESSTFAGFRSRWTSRTEWIAVRAVATPMAMLRSRPAGTAPWALMKSEREGPSMYSVTR